MLFSPLGAAIIGVISAFAMVYGIEFVDKVLKVDDPVGAVGVHCINGVVEQFNWCICYGWWIILWWRLQIPGVQCLGVAAVRIWSVATATILFKGIKATIGLRVTREEEIRGLDIEEHGLESSYADFQSVDINM
ncbi:hypothetical protein [Clostridium butyricum]|uniref:hypothetical protein n=1 Tax=Clostridium butyricum TaxID=1492 RepID=UPI002ABD5F5F|nr:hypothetical protein [Clostridium butyricum]